MFWTYTRLLSAVSVAILSACTSLAAHDEPAIIADGNHESHAEIVRAISAMLGVAPVTIAEDAFTKQSMLLIERVPARDASGQRLSGRDMGKPEQFQLVKHGRECVLVHANSGARQELARTECAVSP
jgi:hypothetical protein